MNKKHAPLIIAIALPIIFVLVLLIAIVVPSMKINPEFDFVYIDTSEPYKKTFNGYQFKNTYDVKDGKIIKVPVQIYIDPNLAYPNLIEHEDAPTIYYYDMSEDAVREISFEEAQEFTLAKGPSSPDGYTVKFEYNNDGIFELFGSNNDESGYVISKGSAKKQLHGIDTFQYYSGDIDIIGWVK